MVIKVNRQNKEQVKYRVLRAFALGGEKDAHIGDEIELPVNEAFVKQSQGKVSIVEVEQKRPRRPIVEVEQKRPRRPIGRQSREPRADHRDPRALAEAEAFKTLQATANETAAAAQAALNAANADPMNEEAQAVAIQAEEIAVAAAKAITQAQRNQTPA